VSVSLLAVIPPFREKEAVFEDVFVRFTNALLQTRNLFDRERKQKLVPEDTVLQTREEYFPSLGLELERPMWSCA